MMLRLPFDIPSLTGSPVFDWSIVAIITAFFYFTAYFSKVTPKIVNMAGGVLIYKDYSG